MPDKKILVVDDDPHIVRLIQINLERAGYEVVSACDGKEGLDKVRSEKPNLVILDISMPLLDGFDVLKTLRGDRESDCLPVIILTGVKTRNDDIFEGYHRGADLYMIKPFDPDMLLDSVNRLTANQEQ